MTYFLKHNAIDHPIDATRFTLTACDPRQSVVVEACAGSGKTWLLVARMVRLLLSGATPASLLAITFTRRAAQEMRERLFALLEDLALQPTEVVVQLLRERGVADDDLPAVLPIARDLYDRVLASPQALSIDTFHSWFARLLPMAPLVSQVPHGFRLTETTGEYLAKAYEDFMRSLRSDQPFARQTKTALLSLYARIGDTKTKQLLDVFVSRRAEWWAGTTLHEDFAMDALHALCGEDTDRDPQSLLWDDAVLLSRIHAIAQLLGKGSSAHQTRAVAIEKAVTTRCFEALCEAFFDPSGVPRKNRETKDFVKAVGDGGMVAMVAFHTEFNAVATLLLRLERRRQEADVLAINEALFRCGNALVEAYQHVKASARVFDFTDLEWHAYRLMSDPACAAHMQARLDTRYQHLLLDEFQDTNPLQWCILREWLQAYGGDAHPPSVFVVGDPKQSIYRFRRAEPRIFHAAQSFFEAQGAKILKTNHTRRNAQPIVAAINDRFQHNPLFSMHSTESNVDGAVWRLPLNPLPLKMTEDAAVWRNPLTTPQADEDDVRRYEEGVSVVHALCKARAKLVIHDSDLGNDRSMRWSDVMLLVRKRTHLAAYEHAFRQAGIPCISDRRGGLLDALEITDVIALLTFLATPEDDRSLAHVLKSPIGQASDEDLIVLAKRSEPSWWARLLAVVGDPDLAEDCSPPLRKAAQQLVAWQAKALMLSVHDLLDVILHEGDLMARYAQATPANNRAHVLRNIETFIELSLNIDAGRYPSLLQFLDTLRTWRQRADAPDEAHADVNEDAVRILTVHSAKGLEAPVVVILDANHSEPTRDDVGVLCDWPEHRPTPTHFSVFTSRYSRGAAREALFAAEEAFKAQEDWNLLYVATTRAKQCLIVSGVANQRGEGTPGSWYERLGRC